MADDDERALLRADDLQRRELVRTQKDARQTIDRGVVLLALVPVIDAIVMVLVLAFGASNCFFPLLLAAAYTVIGSVAGIAMIVGGGTRSRRLTRELRSIDERHQLPAARVVIKR